MIRIGTICCFEKDNFIKSNHHIQFRTPIIHAYKSFLSLSFDTRFYFNFNKNDTYNAFSLTVLGFGFTYIFQRNK